MENPATFCIVQIGLSLFSVSASLHSPISFWKEKLGTLPGHIFSTLPHTSPGTMSSGQEQGQGQEETTNGRIKYCCSPNNNHCHLHLSLNERNKVRSGEQVWEEGTRYISTGLTVHRTLRGRDGSGEATHFGGSSWNKDQRELLLAQFLPSTACHVLAYAS